ncbi:hypothetical protein H4F94_00205, partial [Streptomyces sp. SP18CM02]|nr:hypothetical protein [Streptomyces sp. SP18CM02]
DYAELGERALRNLALDEEEPRELQDGADAAGQAQRDDADPARLQPVHAERQAADAELQAQERIVRLDILAAILVQRQYPNRIRDNPLLAHRGVGQLLGRRGVRFHL